MRRGIALAAAGLVTLVFAPGASGSFHLMSIREVSLGQVGPDSAFIELQMYAPGQNFVNGHPVTLYTATGGLLATFTLNANVPNGETQRTILIGDTGAAGNPDFVYDQLGDAINPYGAGGAACFDSLDCVSWGSFTGNAMLPSSAGTPAAAIGASQSLHRSIARGCETLLEANDDTDDSAADFIIAAAEPRNNSSPIIEKQCAEVDDKAPQTTITKAPPKKTNKDTVTFKYESSEGGRKFSCSLSHWGSGSGLCNGGKHTFKNLDPGKYKFKVAARDATFNFDESPAKATFKILDD